MERDGESVLVRFLSVEDAMGDWLVVRCVPSTLIIGKSYDI